MSNEGRAISAVFWNRKVCAKILTVLGLCKPTSRYTYHLPYMEIGFLFATHRLKTASWIWSLDFVGSTLTSLQYRRTSEILSSHQWCISGGYVRRLGLMSTRTGLFGALETAVFCNSEKTYIYYGLRASTIMTNIENASQTASEICDVVSCCRGPTEPCSFWKFV